MTIVDLFKNKSKPSDRFERLIKPYIETLYRFAFQLCNSKNDSEELVQQLLTRLFLRLNQLENIEKLSPWLCRSLYNLYIDNKRKSAREMAIFSGEEFSVEDFSHDHTPFEEACSKDLSNSIYAALNKLNDDQRITVLLHDAEGYTLAELAEILQTPLGTLKSRLNRARNLLKKLISMEPFDKSSRVINTKRR